MAAGKNDGGPAFKGGAVSQNKDGMSLRDWFAGQALAGMLADGELTETKIVWARIAYQLADAMLEAREE